jgi:hypothetical protein
MRRAASPRSRRRLAPLALVIPTQRAIEALARKLGLVTCNDTEWPQGREYGDRLSARLGPHYPLLGWGMNENPCSFWQRPDRT